MIVDGRAIAAEILADVKAGLSRNVVVRAVSVSPNAATESYLKIKERRAKDAGMELEVVRLTEATTENVIRAVIAPGADAAIVQLPLPAHIDTQAVLDAIPLSQDADVLSAAGYERFRAGGVMPPVAAAVEEVLTRSGFEVSGKKAAVIGKGRLVGMPVAEWLTRKGTEVTVYSTDTGFPETLDADIVVTGAGVPRLVQPSMVRPGAVLIDAGTSEDGGVIAGDIDPACAEAASVYTPVPGGVGPVAVACLFRNVSLLVKELA